MTPHDALVDVRIIGFPLDLQQVSNSWHDELLREFALVALSSQDGAQVPRQLLELVDKTRERYAEFTADAEASQVSLRASGESRGDFDYRVPAAIAEACEQLNEALERAEVYCQAGNLLTMRPPAVVSAFRRWILTEFVHQIREGASPVPWDAYARRLGLPVS